MNLSLLILIVTICYAAAVTNNTFPQDFTFGVATSAYQVEGHGMEDRGENIWDHAIKANPKVIEDGSNATSADDSYTHYKDDIKSLVQMGVTHYKLSVSWSRIMPSGYTTNENNAADGITYYKTLIQELVSHNITPIVALYHWDLPQIIQDHGGWTNESNIDAFVAYAKTVFTNLPEAKYFITFDNPRATCKNGYGDGTLAPFSKNSGVDDYKCARILLKAHTAVYNMFKKEFASKSAAKISISLDASWSIPASNKSEDIEAAERRNQFEFGLYANAIFNTGNWPQVVIDRTDQRSKAEGRKESRLPMLSKDEKEAIKGTFDFMAVEFFDTKLVADSREEDFKKSSYDNDMRVKISNDESWKVDTDDHAVVPGSLRDLLKYLRDTYNNPEILITASGIADDSGLANDNDRVTFLADQLSDVADAIQEDKVNVIGYTYWSLLDSFEWTKGMKPHFGLCAVHSDSDMLRVEKKSAEYYALVIKERKPIDPAGFQPPTGAGNSFQPMLTLFFAISTMVYIF